MRAALGLEEAPREELRESIMVIIGIKFVKGGRSLKYSLSTLV